MSKFEKLLGGVTVIAASGYIYRIIKNVVKTREEAMSEEESQ